MVPYGDTNLEYVRVGNCLASRSVLLAGLMQMLGGCWFIEQPASSRLIWYPRFEWLSHSAWSTTWQIGWWARHFKALTPKRHRAWSNSMEIGVLNRGVLTKKQRDSCPVKTTDRRVKLDATGKSNTTWSGNKNLKKTQPRPQLACKLQPLVSTCRATFMSCNLPRSYPRSYPIPFGLHTQRYMQVLRSSGCGNFILEVETESAPDMFSKMAWSTWPEARHARY